ncbi:MAG: hypothetical protein OFPI_35200 [Osedax symbiont Rs2]|nr:MAG: hypothetical protein OFPI_35200 [Osedax symbiont Rs2]
MLHWRKQDIAQSSASGVNQAATTTAGNGQTVQPSDSDLQAIKMSDGYVRPAMILTAFALFCGLMYNAAGALWKVLDRPIEQLSVTGNTQYLQPQQLMAKLATVVQHGTKSGSLLSIDIHELQQRALEDPWVNSAAIRRQWPPAVKVTVEEQVAVAKWGGKGLLNHQGDIFIPEDTVSLDFLPLLNGPSTDTARVMDQYHTLSQFFKGGDTYMLGLTLQARGAWTLLLNNQIEVELGREQVLARLRRFLQLYRGHLYLKGPQIERVDVRYSNGVAVKWRPGLEQIQVN